MEKPVLGPATAHTQRRGRPAPLPTGPVPARPPACLSARLTKRRSRAATRQAHTSVAKLHSPLHGYRVSVCAPAPGPASLGRALPASTCPAPLVLSRPTLPGPGQPRAARGPTLPVVCGGPPPCPTVTPTR
jgi:hypothetical protein